MLDEGLSEEGDVLDAEFSVETDGFAAEFPEEAEAFAPESLPPDKESLEEGVVDDEPAVVP